MLIIYRAYEEICERSGLVDFAELLLRAHELLRDNQDVLDFYQQRFQAGACRRVSGYEHDSVCLVEIADPGQG